MFKLILLVLLFPPLAIKGWNITDSLHLPQEHIQYWVNRDNALRSLCFQNEICRLKVTVFVVVQ